MAIRHMTAADAIRQSAAQNEIVHILSLAAVQCDLLAECDDWTEAGEDEHGAIYEYWGEDADGDEWRVHVHAASPH